MCERESDKEDDPITSSLTSESGRGTPVFSSIFTTASTEAHSPRVRCTSSFLIKPLICSRGSFPRKIAHRKKKNRFTLSGQGKG